MDGAILLAVQLSRSCDNSWSCDQSCDLVDSESAMVSGIISQDHPRVASTPLLNIYSKDGWIVSHVVFNY